MKSKEATDIGIYLKRSKNYVGNYWMCYTVAGRQVFESTFTKNRKLAQKLFALRQAEIIAGRWSLPPPSAPKFGEFADEFLESIRVLPTKTRYAASLKRLFLFYDRRAPLSSITTESVEKFRTERLREVTAATANRDLCVLSLILKCAVRRRLIARHPAESLVRLDERADRRQPRILSYEDEERILAHAGEMLKTLTILILETGLRINKEALQLQWSSLDLDQGFVIVQASKTRAGLRTLPLSNRCRATLESWKELAGNASAYLFFNPNDPSKFIGSVKKTWSTTLRKAGIPYFPIYSLRANFASRLSAAGVADSFVSQMLGHAGGLLQTYSKATQPYQREAIAKLENLRMAAQQLNS